jgi:excinuclease ABC subunit A
MSRTSIGPGRSNQDHRQREPEQIVVEGAREHNLRVDRLAIPKHQLVVITGPSGSGKSSLAFDTLYAEGQRRYVESLSAYARQFLGQMEKPKYERISGLSPTIAIQQKSASSNPRSTVGTITEIYDYLRVLYARVGEQRCHQCGAAVSKRSAAEIVTELAALPDKTQVTLLAPKAENRKGEFRELFVDARKAGFARVRIDGMIVRLEDVDALEKQKKHSIELVIDRLAISAADRGRLTDSVETALREGKGKLMVDVAGERTPRVYSEDNSCATCGIGFPELSPQSFSFNSPLGMCVACNGLGFKIDLEKPWSKLSDKHRDLLMHGTGDKRVAVAWEGKHSSGEWAMKYEGILAQLERRHRESASDRARAYYESFFRAVPCVTCLGTRLRPESRAVLIADTSITTVTGMTVKHAYAFHEGLKLTGTRAQIAGEVLKEIRNRLTFLLDVGLDYLTLDRAAGGLSGGEAQRIRLASQLGSELSGVLYVLDEPSIGLHQRDNDRLIKTLHRLRDLGNTVLVVEHDEATIEAADWVVDFGPGAGRHGGQVVAEGLPDDVRGAPGSITGAFLAGTDAIVVPAERKQPAGWIDLTGAREHHLTHVDGAIPLGVMVAITGVSGAGKSSLINGTLHPALARQLHGSLDKVGPYKQLKGLEQIDKVIVIDQKPIGRTPRSNPATYTKAFDLIRELFAQTPMAKTYGYAAGRFSFNVSAKQGGGRCEACEGAGAQMLDTPIDEALELFKHHKQLGRTMQTLVDVGLGYISLGQAATTLSGGEAQRVKLAKELARVQTGRTLYLLDEPTTGLHFGDVKKLLEVLTRLVQGGNTVLLVEHNLDVIKTCDWLIDMGPEGGAAGGEVIAVGTPEQVAKEPRSYTGQFLAPLLARKAGGGTKPVSSGRKPTAASNGARA